MATLAARDIYDGDRCFVAYAAHELRGSITLQRTLAEVALADPDADAVALRAMGERIAAACTRQERLLESLLTLSRTAYGRLRREPVDLAVTAAEQLQAHGHDGLRRAATLAPALTTGDPELIERLVSNLVTNAVRHNVRGGWIELATRTCGGRAVLRIANTGPVIPNGELARLFLPFQRLTARARPVGGGVGLGLAIVQAIADAHGATVTPHARTTGGLRIDVSFPAPG